jgi:hypothetical protein
VSLLFAPLLLRFCFLEASSTAYDLPVFLLGFVICAQLARMLEADSRVDHAVIGLLVLTAGAVAMTIKISSAVLAVASIGVWMAWTLKHRRLRLGYWVGLFVLPVLIGMGWVIRNILFCGYPFSPSAIFGLPVEWKVPIWAMDCNARIIMAWARDYQRPANEVLADWAWFWPWFKGVMGFYWIEVVIPVTVAIVSMAAVAIRVMTGYMDGWRWKALFLMPPLLGLVFWFFTAPDQRFAGAAFWWLASGGLILMIASYGGATRRICWLPIVMLSLMLTGWFDGRLSKYTRPGPSSGGFYPVPESKVKTFRTDSGLEVYVPVKGDQVWDSPLPATPYPNAKLKLRHAGDVASGFRMGQ